MPYYTTINEILGFYGLSAVNNLGNINFFMETIQWTLSRQFSATLYQSYTHKGISLVLWFSKHMATFCYHNLLIIILNLHLFCIWSNLWFALMNNRWLSSSFQQEQYGIRRVIHFPKATPVHIQWTIPHHSLTSRMEIPDGKQCSSMRNPCEVFICIAVSSVWRTQLWWLFHCGWNQNMKGIYLWRIKS